MLYYIISYYVILYYSMLCYIILYYISAPRGGAGSVESGRASAREAADPSASICRSRSRIQGSVRFGSVRLGRFGSVRFGFLLLPVM